MAESAYHNEALRRQRAIERKNEAQRRLLNGPQSNEAQLEGYPDYKDPILYSGPGHFEQSRSSYNRVGRARDRRQYDHSRNGPVLPGSWSGLKRELYGIGQGTPLLGKGHPMTIRDLQQIRYVTPRP